MAWQPPPAVCSTCCSHLCTRHRLIKAAFLKKKEAFSSCVFIKKKTLTLKTLCLWIVRCNCYVSAHIIISTVECLPTKRPTQTLPCSSLYGLKVFSDPQRTRLYSIVLLEQKQRKITYCVCCCVRQDASTSSTLWYSLQPSHPSQGGSFLLYNNAHFSL